MISTKTKLVSAIAMLLVATIMMTSASFAWFTISTAPEVSGLDVSMVATRNFEIARIADGAENTIPTEPAIGDATDETKWGATVSFSSSAALVFPAYTSNNAIVSVKYAADGRIMADPATMTQSAFIDGVSYYKANINGTGTGDEKWVTCAAVYGMWLRSNISGTATVTIPSITVSALNSGATLTADQVTKLKDAVKVTIMYASSATEYLTPDTAYDPSSASSTISVPANQGFKVFVTVYFDGDKIYAEDIVNGLKIDGFDLQFVHNQTLGTDLNGDGTIGTDEKLMTF